MLHCLALGKTGTMHTILFVTGASLSTKHAEPLQPAIEKAGYQFVALALPSADIREPRPTYEGDVVAIHEALQRVTTSSTTLVLHSYAGVAGRDAASRFVSNGLNSKSKSNLEHIIFIAAMNRFTATDKPFAADPPSLIIRHEAGINYLIDPAGTAFSDLSPETAKPYVDAVTPQTLPLPTEVDFWGPASTEAWRKVPAAYVVCRKDRLMRPEYQLQQADSVGGKVYERDWDHCPMISHPDELAEIVIEAAS